MLLRKEPIISACVLIALWQLVSLWFPPVLFPSITSIARQLVDILGDGGLIVSALATFARILVGTSGAFVVGGLLGLWMGRSSRCERYTLPVLAFNQGIPALSWVVISIIWFKSTEFRIWFIILMTSLPAFAFQVHDSYKAMSKDLVEMSLSFRPSKWDLFRTLIWPSILPGILTAWKVNLGNVSRVVVVAELVGATVGVGYELLQRQQLFDMAGAIAWTLLLVVFVIVTQAIVAALERHLLRYRPTAERQA